MEWPAHLLIVGGGGVTITLDNIEHSDFSVLIEAPNGSPQPMSTFYVERAFQRVLTHPISS